MKVSFLAWTSILSVMPHHFFFFNSRSSIVVILWRTWSTTVWNANTLCFVVVGGGVWSVPWYYNYHKKEDPIQNPTPHRAPIFHFLLEFLVIFFSIYRLTLHCITVVQRSWLWHYHCHIEGLLFSSSLHHQGLPLRIPTHHLSAYSYHLSGSCIDH